MFIILLRNKYIAFVFSEHYDFLSHRTDRYYIDMLLWSKLTIKTQERCHAVFIFNFQHIQQINLILLLLTLTCIAQLGTG